MHDMAKNKETLKKRYENLLTQSNKLANTRMYSKYLWMPLPRLSIRTPTILTRQMLRILILICRAQLEGIGASLLSENEYVTIKTIVPGGPADKSHK